MKTRITELLGIEQPIIQGGMAWIADAKLAAAVSEAGGLGIIACGSAPVSWVREQVEEARRLTDKPFGLNIMLMNPEAPELAKLAAEMKVRVVTTAPAILETTSICGKRQDARSFLLWLLLLWLGVWSAVGRTLLWLKAARRAVISGSSLQWRLPLRCRCRFHPRYCGRRHC